MENGPFKDVFPIKNGDIPASYVTPLKINMEHNHGGLEDHFPF